jgi:biopolymer transport protein ExbB
LRPIVSFVLMASVLTLALGLSATLAQEPPTKTPAKAEATKAPEKPAKEPISLWGMIWDGTFIGGVIQIAFLGLSVAAVALTIEHIMQIRANALMPPGMAEQLHEMIAGGHLAQAEQQCKLQPCFLSYVVHAGLSEVEGGWPVVEKSMEDTAAEHAARLFRKIEYLSVIANLAPMLGLLGTVVGMVIAFKMVADTQGVANAADLAGGIYLALVTTVEGLVIAIPTLGVFAFFRNRIEELVAEASSVASHVFAPLRRRAASGKTAAPRQPQGAPAAAPGTGGR